MIIIFHYWFLWILSLSCCFCQAIHETLNIKEIIIDNLKHQFDIYKQKGFNLTDMQDLSSCNVAKTCMGHFQIIDQKLFVRQPHEYTARLRCQQFIQGLENTLAHHAIQNIDFMVFFWDFIVEDKQFRELLKKVPCLMFSKDLSLEVEKDLPLLPDPYIMAKWKDLISEIEEAGQQYPWEKKLEKVFWRGASSSGSHLQYIWNNVENFDKQPRLILTILSKFFPEVIDARFSDYLLFKNDHSGKLLLNFLTELLGKAQFASYAEHIHHKYLISIDGLTAAWLRPIWIMYSNSILLMQETKRAQFFYPVMHPFEHYIPISNNLSNIFEKIKWLKKHDNMARKITEQAHTLVATALMPDDLEEYTAIVLNTYGTLQNFQLTNATLKPYIAINPAATS